MMKRIVFLFLLSSSVTFGASLLIPMDESQANHLKAYGMAYWALSKDVSVEWLLNYKGGSFVMQYSSSTENEARIRGVTALKIPDSEAEAIRNYTESPSLNMNWIKMEKAPRVAVYSPKNAMINDESDAVITVLDYAEIPYTIIYDEEILHDTLQHFDWLHLHHEDFTGQLSKSMLRQGQVENKLLEINASRMGYTRVSAMKYDVVKKMIAFTASGGYLFAMCSGAETFDIALAAEGQDIETAQEGVDLDYSKSLAFENFMLFGTGNRSFSDINKGTWNWGSETEGNYFSLFDFSAKWDIIPSLLTQNHQHVIRDFSGLTGAFNHELVKPSAVVLGENKQKPNVRYIYGELGKGHWTYYSGHDPESRGGGRRGQKTDLNLYPHSPGYRLILNNVLFPSASKKKRKT